jgi:hypothetical protein
MGSDMDLARAPRRTARKKGSGYENAYAPRLDRTRVEVKIAGNRIQFRSLLECISFLPVKD